MDAKLAQGKHGAKKAQKKDLIPWVMDLIPSWPLLGRSWALLGASWSTFSHFFRLWGASVFEVAFRSDFSRFFVDFGWIWEGFWDDFSTIFRIFVKITIL